MMTAIKLESFKYNEAYFELDSSLGASESRLERELSESRVAGNTPRHAAVSSTDWIFFKVTFGNPINKELQ